MDEDIAILLQRVQTLLANNAEPQKRVLIALAGGPGSGKSTIANKLAEYWNSQNEVKIQVLPMDGFHYKQSILSGMQASENPFLRRGAPFTFDGDAFVELVRRLRSSAVVNQVNVSGDIWAPSFDHATKDPVERDICIPCSRKIVLLEGNYLLLDDNPWKEIKNLVDESWLVHVHRQTAKQRLIARHIASGIEKDWPSAAARAENNDLRNADLISRKSLAADFVIMNEGCSSLLGLPVTNSATNVDIETALIGRVMG